MARCVNFSGQWVIDDAAMANANPETCAYVALTGADYASLKSGGGTLGIGTREDADAILTAFLVLFAIVFGFKMIVRAINTGDPANDERH